MRRHVTGDRGFGNATRTFENYVTRFFFDRSSSFMKCSRLKIVQHHHVSTRCNGLKKRQFKERYLRCGATLTSRASSTLDVSTSIFIENPQTFRAATTALVMDP